MKVRKQGDQSVNNSLKHHHTLKTIFPSQKKTIFPSQKKTIRDAKTEDTKRRLRFSICLIIRWKGKFYSSQFPKSYKAAFTRQNYPEDDNSVAHCCGSFSVPFV